MYVPVMKKKRNSKYGNNNWFSYSSKMSRNVYLYSDLEYDHWIRIEFDPNIKLFCEQPLHVKDYVGGEYIDTIFDMWVQTIDGQETFIEVKYAEELNPKHKNYSERSVNQIRKQKLWCEANGYKYEVHTDDWVYSNRLLVKNLRKMLPYIDNRKLKDVNLRQKIQYLLSNSDKTTIDYVELELNLYTKHQVREVICSMIFEGNLNANLEITPFGKDLEVWKNESN